MKDYSGRYFLTRCLCFLLIGSTACSQPGPGNDPHDMGIPQNDLGGTGDPDSGTTPTDGLGGTDGMTGGLSGIPVTGMALNLLAGGLGGGGHVDDIGRAARMSSTGGIAYDGAGNFYFAQGSNTVRKL